MVRFGPASPAFDATGADGIAVRDADPDPDVTSVGLVVAGPPDPALEQPASSTSNRAASSARVKRLLGSRPAEIDGVLCGMSSTLGRAARGQHRVIPYISRDGRAFDRWLQSRRGAGAPISRSPN